MAISFPLPTAKKDTSDLVAQKEKQVYEKIKQYAQGLVTIQDIISPEAIELDFSEQKINSSYTSREIAEIGRIARGEGASLHLHLPTDADCDTRKAAAAMVNKAAIAMERAAVLQPHSFVLHLDFPSLRGKQHKTHRQRS